MFSSSKVLDRIVSTALPASSSRCLAVRNRRQSSVASTSAFRGGHLSRYTFSPSPATSLCNGNATLTQFSGANGVIKVTHSFPNGGVGTSDNDNNAIFPSQFTTMFPGTGLVQGHLAQTVYAHTSTVTFDMTGYNITPNTVFGMWNTTDEVTAPAGGNPVYRVQLLDSGNLVQNPSTFSYMGNQDNQTQVQGSHSLVMNTINGDSHIRRNDQRRNRHPHRRRVLAKHSTLHQANQRYRRSASAKHHRRRRRLLLRRAHRSSRTIDDRLNRRRPVLTPRKSSSKKPIEPIPLTP